MADGDNVFYFPGEIIALSANIESISFDSLIATNEQTTGYNNQFIAGNANTTNATTSVGLHMGYDSVANVGSIYAENAVAGLTDIYLNLPTYTTGTTSIHVPNLAIPSTGTSSGIIYQNGSPLLQTYGLLNTFLGASAGNLTLSGIGNTALGNNVMPDMGTGSYNIAIGQDVISNITSSSTANFNLAIGAPVMSTNTVTGSENVAMGASSLNNLTSGYRNVCVGNGTGDYFTTGYYNTFVGYTTGQASTTGTPGTGYNNVGVGSAALQYITTGYENTALGNGACGHLTTGFLNIGIGYESLYLSAITGNSNTGIGYRGLYSITSGSNNVGIGYQAGSSVTTGSNNVFIGQNAGMTCVGNSNNIIIGTSTGDTVTSNEIIIGSSSTSCQIQGIYGVAPSGTSYAVGITSGNQLTNGVTNISIYNGSNFANINNNATSNITFSLPVKTTNDTFAMITDFDGPGNPLTFGGIGVSVGVSAVTVFTFYFPGSAYRTYTKFVVTYVCASTYVITVNLLDITNSTIIGAGTTPNNTTASAFTVSSLAFIPAGGAVWQLTAAATGAGNTVYSFSLE